MKSLPWGKSASGRIELHRTIWNEQVVWNRES